MRLRGSDQRRHGSVRYPGDDRFASVTMASSIAFSFRRCAYENSVAGFLEDPPDRVVGTLVGASDFDTNTLQARAWETSIGCLRAALPDAPADGRLFLEFDVPRLGKRIDAVLFLAPVLIVIEFKVGQRTFAPRDTEQVTDYALDLKHFHETSRTVPTAPVLVATDAPSVPLDLGWDENETLSGLLRPLRCNAEGLAGALVRIREFCAGRPSLTAQAWYRGRYRPTPTIVEAARALYAGHDVREILRSEARNLGETAAFVRGLVTKYRTASRKGVCFVTGVPGSGKTLVGLDLAAPAAARGSAETAVYLSGNGPLVAVLQEALARDWVERERRTARRATKTDALRRARMFVQNVHHFRDEYLRDPDPPYEHVVVFDEAQRAWNREQTARFMKRRRGQEFDRSESSFLLSCLDRHPDWAWVVCLVGHGQEIHTGEAGIGEWLRAVQDHFPDWDVHVSPHFAEAEYGLGSLLESLGRSARLYVEPCLHLDTSLRSFRSERYAAFVDRLLACDLAGARALFAEIRARFPLCLTRDLTAAKGWLRSRARGTERYGLVASSKAQRLRPLAIDVRVSPDPTHWFLDPSDDPRSSFYLEEAATEFQIQGLELDWSGVLWDADLRATGNGWEYFDFRGDGWCRVRHEERRAHLVNAYRVLLTRARQGSVLVVPRGEPSDPTRDPVLYDGVYRYLRDVGIPELET
jgi:hypothetical protein